MTGQNDPYLSPVPGEVPPKKGKNPVLIIVLILGGVAVLGTLACCGGMAMLGSSVMKMSPGAVDAVTEEIVDIDVRPPWQPTMAMDMSNFGVPMRMAMYNIDQHDGQNMLMLMDMDQDPQILEQPEAFEQSMRQQVKQQSRQRNASVEKIRQVSSEPIDMQINGRPAHIKLAEAVGQQSGDEYYEVLALFMGAERPAMLYLRANQQQVTRGEVLALLRSMDD